MLFEKTLAMHSQGLSKDLPKKVSERPNAPNLSFLVPKLNLFLQCTLFRAAAVSPRPKVSNKTCRHWDSHNLAVFRMICLTVKIHRRLPY